MLTYVLLLLGALRVLAAAVELPVLSLPSLMSATRRAGDRRASPASRTLAHALSVLVIQPQRRAARAAARRNANARERKFERPSRTA